MRLAVMAAPHDAPHMLNAVLADAAEHGADRLLLLRDGKDEPASDVARAISDQIHRSLLAGHEFLTVGSLPFGLGSLGRRPPAWACGGLAPGDLSALREVPDELAHDGVITFDFPSASQASRSDDEYRAAATALLVARPIARVCIGLFEPAPAAVTVARDGTVSRADHAIAGRIGVEGLTFVSPGRPGRRREDAGVVGWAAIDSDANTVELHSVRYQSAANVERTRDGLSLDPHTSRVAAELRAWLSGTPQHAA